MGLFRNARRSAARDQFVELYLAAMDEAMNIDADLSSGNIRSMPATALRASRAFAMAAESADLGLRDHRVVGWCRQMSAGCLRFSERAFAGTAEQGTAEYDLLHSTVEQNSQALADYLGRT